MIGYLVHKPTAKAVLAHATSPVTILLALGLAVLAVPRWTTPNAVAQAGVRVNGHAITDVRFDGKLESLQHYYGVDQKAAAAKGQAPHLIMDQSAVARGYFVAFTNPAAAQTYMSSHGLGNNASSDPAPSALPADQRVTDGGSSSLDGTPITLATCSLTSYVFMWKDASCSGQQLDMVKNDAIPNFATYGFNDVMSSAEVGYCISNLSLWINSNYSGSETTLGGGDYYTTMPSGFNDDVSSSKTDSSGAC